MGGYVTDFPTPELIGHPRVLAMPHIGASTGEAEDNCAVMAADQLIDFLENGNIKNSVNFPDASMARGSDFRLTFSNSNVPNVLVCLESNIGTGANVIDLVNQVVTRLPIILWISINDYRRARGCCFNLDGVIRVGRVISEMDLALESHTSQLMTLMSDLL